METRRHRLNKLRWPGVPGENGTIVAGHKNRQVKFGMDCKVIAPIDLQLNSLKTLMFSNVTGEVEKLQLVGTSLSHAADEELVAFVLLINAEVNVVGSNSQRITTVEETKIK